LYRLRDQSQEPQFLIDTEAINKRLAAHRKDPRRVFTGSFRVPKGASPGELDRIAREAIGRFIDAMLKKGWDLYSRVSVYPNGTAHDIDSSIPLLDKDEYLAKAVFKLANTPKLIRDEVPSGLVKRDLEHRITLAEAIKART
jgi:hypothetical protein